jgi:polar amino acid transport system substrate-binding protein
MRAALLLAALIVVSIGTGAAADEEALMKELAPTGKLRVGIAYAPAPTPVFVAKNASGQAYGVPLDLATALAKALNIRAEIMVAATTGELTEACASGAIDVGVMPIDDERRKRLDFSPPYFVIESTYLARSPAIRTLADVDRPDVVVVGIDGSTTMRAAARSLKIAKVVPAKSVDEAMALMADGTAQAFALTHDALPALQPRLPSSRILDGAFQRTGVALAVQKNRPAALAYITHFIESAKTDGTVRRAFDAVGLNSLPVAPAEPGP